ncbi:MAG: DUF1330 domain-containing protein [Gammaproteobacteria bacterium]|nr:DUF1330 domain-containing protein [Gammaproteobacteria bacterium]
MTAYLIVEAKIKDRMKFLKYAQKVQELVAQYGGKYVVLGGEHEPLEGEWDDERIVIHRWPNMQSARDFWFSAEYQETKKLRDGTGEFRIMLVEGVQESI